MFERKGNLTLKDYPFFYIIQFFPEARCILHCVKEDPVSINRLYYINKKIDIRFLFSSGTLVPWIVVDENLYIPIHETV